MEMRTRHLAKKDVAFASLTMPSDKFGYLAQKAGTSATTNANVATLLERIDLFEKICFSPYVPSLEEYEQMLQWIKELT